MSTPILNTLARRSALKSLLLATAVFSLPLAIFSCVREDDLTDDQRVYQLSQQLMCPVCDGQTLDQSQAQLSEDMKVVIRTKIEEGATNSEIRKYFVDRYGEIVLASPDVDGFNIVAWVMPVVIFLGGALLVGNAYLNMRRRERGDYREEATKRDNAGSASDTGSEPELTEYLERVDLEIASASNATAKKRDRA